MIVASANAPMFKSSATSINRHWKGSRLDAAIAQEAPTKRKKQKGERKIKAVGTAITVATLNSPVTFI